MIYSGLRFMHLPGRNPMPRLAPLLALPILLGCASATQTYAPDGRSAHAVNCGGLWRDWVFLRTAIVWLLQPIF
jgi:hypothetical protein